VEPGHEVVLTDDGCINSLYGAQSSSGTGVPVSREQGIRVFERAFCFDTMELGHVDYSFKPVKPLVAMEQQAMESVLHATIVPMFYGAMPNMALYARPDGPFGNPADLLPAGKIAEAREAQEEAAQALTRDMVYVGHKMAEVGTDGFNLDTCASAGDAEFLATLETVRALSQSTAMGIEVGMAAEFVLGMHGELTWEGVRLAGLYPHQQVRLVEQAGAAIFGPVVNTNTRRSSPWNIARAATFVRACGEAAGIPVHPNVGNGTCGVPMAETPPIDIVTRAGVAMVELGKADGL
jgi:dimethylamine--corrinoid protein Co-methyltransferase